MLKTANSIETLDREKLIEVAVSNHDYKFRDRAVTTLENKYPDALEVVINSTIYVGTAVSVIQTGYLSQETLKKLFLGIFFTRANAVESEYIRFQSLKLITDVSFLQSVLNIEDDEVMAVHIVNRLLELDKDPDISVQSANKQKYKVTFVGDAFSAGTPQQAFFTWAIDDDTALRHATAQLMKARHGSVRLANGRTYGEHQIGILISDLRNSDFVEVDIVPPTPKKQLPLQFAKKAFKVSPHGDAKVSLDMSISDLRTTGLADYFQISNGHIEPVENMNYEIETIGRKLLEKEYYDGQEWFLETVIPRLGEHVIELVFVSDRKEKEEIASADGVSADPLDRFRTVTFDGFYDRAFLKTLKKDASLKSTVKFILDLVAPFVYLFGRNPKLKAAIAILQDLAQDKSITANFVDPGRQSKEIIRRRAKQLCGNMLFEDLELGEILNLCEQLSQEI